MRSLLRRYLPDGSIRSLWQDDFAMLNRKQGLKPLRASRVEVIEEGPQAGRFYVDMSPLAIATNNWNYMVCLLPTHERYDAAVAAEQAWIKENWVLKFESKMLLS